MSSFIRVENNVVTTVRNDVEGFAAPWIEDARARLDWVGRTYIGGQIGPVLVKITPTKRAAMFDAMTAIELHAWYRAFLRASLTDAPTATDRDGLYAWLRWTSLDGDVAIESADLDGLKNVWMALGMNATRADALLAVLTTA